MAEGFQSDQQGNKERADEELLPRLSAQSRKQEETVPSNQPQYKFQVGGKRLRHRPDPTTVLGDGDAYREKLERFLYPLEGRPKVEKETPNTLPEGLLFDPAKQSEES